MSGVEAAGLVLGAFPIVISALESYRDAFRFLSSWWKFQRTFENLIDDIGTEKALFENNLEKLFSPFVDSDVHMSTLLGDPLGPAWSRPDLSEKLQDRLGTSFIFYQAIVNRINETLSDLQRQLGLDSEKAINLWRRRDVSQFDVKDEFKRIRVCFKNNRLQQHVDQLSKQNSRLRELLSSNDALTSSRRQRSITPNSVVLRQLQSRALSIHAALQSSWKCSCRSHTTQLRLERRINDKSMVDGNWKVIFHMPSSNPDHEYPKEMEVEVMEDDCQTKHPDSSGGKINAHADNPIYRFKRSIEAEKVQMAVTESKGTASVAGVAGVLTGVAGLHVSDVAVSALPGIRHHRHQKQVTFANSCRPRTSPMIKAPASITPINDMCTVLRSPSIDSTCLGFLHDRKKRRHIFYPSRDYVTGHPLTLRDALKVDRPQYTHKVMSRKDRLRVAMIMASSVLQLHATPWLNEKWNKNDVILYLDETRQRVIPDPFVHTSFQPGIDTTESYEDHGGKSRFNTKKVLPNLGIALLELCFGKVIEDHPCRSQYFGPNNQPNAFTDISTARVWHEDVLDEVGDNMSECIRRCLNCAFAPKPNLEDKEFQEAFFDGVIVPLQETLRIWEQI